MADLVFYRGLYSGQQIDSAVARALSGGALDQEIAALRSAVGSPLVANTIAEMTNTNRIYVYTGSEAGYTAGHWYYWNGSAWTDGGAYNSAAADDAMSDSSTNAVQNKVIKAYVDGAVEDVDEEIETINQELANKADVDGDYPDMTVGTARQLVGTSGASDSAPYTFRRSGGGVSVGNRAELRQIVGGTVGWNQLVSVTSSDDLTSPMRGIDVSWSDGKYTLTGTATSSGGRTSSQAKMIALKEDHVYVASFSSAHAIIWSLSSTTSGSVLASFNNQHKIFKITASDSAILGFNVIDGTTVNESYYIFITDLTLMFGSAIVDYLYSLETATAGAGIAKLKEWGFDFSTYHAYNAGTLESVKTSAKTTVGFNQWDEEWESGSYDQTTGAKIANANVIRNVNPIALIPSQRLFTVNGANTTTYFYWYDAERNYIGYNAYLNETEITPPDNACFANFRMNAAYGTTYNHDICVNISDPAKNGTYEPYSAHTYAITPVELRGILMLDANNNLYYDGDNYAPDGAVTRKYGIVDLGTVQWVAEHDFASGQFRSIAKDWTKIPKYQGNLICSSGYKNNKNHTYKDLGDGEIGIGNDVIKSIVRIHDSKYANYTAENFKAAMSGVYLVYELTTPTTETAAPFQSMQIVDADGTEAFTDAAVEAGERDIAIPVGHETFYPADLAGAIERVMVQVPPPPSGNGNYRLTATVSSGGVTYSWEAV